MIRIRHCLSVDPVARRFVEKVHRRIGEVDADGLPVPTVEGLVSLYRDCAAVDATGDESMVAHEFRRVDFAHDLARVRFRDLAILRPNACDGDAEMRALLASENRRPGPRNGRRQVRHR